MTHSPAMWWSFVAEGVRAVDVEGYASLAGRGRSRWVTPVTTTGYIRPRRVVPATVVSSALPLATSPVIHPLRRRWTVPALGTQPTVFVHPTASMVYPTTPLNLALVLDSN